MMSSNLHRTSTISVMLCRGHAVAVGAAVLLAALPLQAQSESGDATRLRVELYSRGFSLVHESTSGWLGFDSWNWSAENFLEVHVEKGRWRLGTAVSEEIMGLDLVYSHAPVRIDYILWEHPLWYAWRLHGMVPEVALHFSGYWLNNTGEANMRVPLAGRLDLVAAVDFFGLGISVSAGVVGACTSTNYSSLQWDGHAGLSPNIELRLRLLTFGVDLGGDSP